MSFRIHAVGIESLTPFAANHPKADHPTAQEAHKESQSTPRTYIGIPSKLVSSMSRNASSIADLPEVGFWEIEKAGLGTGFCG
jgi:hypothetical protein